MDTEVKSPPFINRLAREKSPYLLQHAHNPVDWYPWGEEALQRARDEDKPILLSIGYSACHWCHVMAHESFEDEATAELMNRLFINIKVDREERPDLDRIYQNAHQILTRRPGGWPLNVFLDPKQIPFAAGTYFPNGPRHGMPPFTEVLQRIAQFYRDKRAAIDEQNSAVVNLLEQADHAALLAGEIDDQPLRLALQALTQSYDTQHGGFGSAPKFPHCANLEFLLHHESAQAREMALKTLRAMAQGGLMDQLGGGFFRYSVDERWEIPHFEKMLYDNGPLLWLYASAWKMTGDTFFRQVVEMTAGWVMREMQSSDGAYYATQDADTEGEEGGFYVWSREAVHAVIEPGDHPVVASHFGLDLGANFEGRWHLKIAQSIAAIAEERQQAPEKIAEVIERARQRLLTLRSYRPAPGIDNKVLVSWNALMIRGMARAGLLLDRADYIESAQHALDFIRQKMFDDGRLAACHKDGTSYLGGYLDDYAFLLEATLTLLQARWRDADIAFAIELADALLDHFEDESNGGFYFTADDHEALIQRPKSFMDDSMPSGNGVAALALHRLGHLLGNFDYIKSAERATEAAWDGIGKYPTAHGSMLLALGERLSPSAHIIVRGSRQALEQWRQTIYNGYQPRRLVLAIPDDAGELPGELALRTAMGRTVAYRCGDGQCAPPVYNANDL